MSAIRCMLGGIFSDVIIRPFQWHLLYAGSGQIIQEELNDHEGHHLIQRESDFLAIRSMTKRTYTLVACTSGHDSLDWCRRPCLLRSLYAQLRITSS
jgi:hypothetical protein